MAVETSSVAPETVTPAIRPRADFVALGLLAVGHAVTDSYGWTLLTPMGPDMQQRLQITTGQWGLLATVMGLSASLGQPLLGWISDRWPRLCMVALGPMLAASFIALVWQASTFAGLALLLFGAGVGIGAFHPQGAMLARRAGRGSGLAMSVFTVGGNIGFGLAPILGGAYLLYFGVDRFYLSAIPAFVFGLSMLAIYYRRSYFGGPTDSAAGGRPGPAARPNRRALTFLTLAVVVRSATHQGLVTFLPFLVVERMGLAESGRARIIVVTTLLLATAVSGPLGGHLADRFGRRKLMLWCFTLAPWPLLAALLGPQEALLPLLAVGGLILMMPHPSNVVMAQEFLPNNAGIGASMITGFGWGLALLVMKPLGDFADSNTMQTALAWLCLVPLLGILLTLGIPESGHGHDEPAAGSRPG